MTFKMFRLTARVAGHDKPLTSFVVQALDEADARRFCRLPDDPRATVRGPVTWDVEEITICNASPPREDTAKLLDEAVRLLELWTEAYDRGSLYEESMDLLRKVRP